MGNTSEYIFEILLSILKRHNTACKRNIDSRKCFSSHPLDRSLSNVRCFPDHIEIKLKNENILELTGSFLKINHQKIPLEDILIINWMTPNNNSSKAVSKRDNFDFIYLEISNNNVITIEEMGQSVFPIMKFLKWVINK